MDLLDYYKNEDLNVKLLKGSDTFFQMIVNWKDDGYIQITTYDNYFDAVRSYNKYLMGN